MVPVDTRDAVPLPRHFIAVCLSRSTGMRVAAASIAEPAGTEATAAVRILIQARWPDVFFIQQNKPVVSVLPTSTSSTFTNIEVRTGMRL